jgi:hypothetical protein
MQKTAICLVVLCLCGLPNTVVAGQLDSIPIDPRAQVLQPEQTTSVPANGGSGAHVIVPGRGVFAVDFAVEPNKQLLLMVVTNDQYNAILAGRQPSGAPLMRVTINGTASQTILLERGQYYVFLGNSASTSTRITYRATWRRA